VENEILLRRIKRSHPNVLRSYLRCRKEATRELARQMGYWPRRERTSGKLQREWNKCRTWQEEWMKRQDRLKMTRQAQNDKKGKRIVEG
jgi:hypothetical protein